MDDQTDLFFETYQWPETRNELAALRVETTYPQEIEAAYYPLEEDGEWVVIAQVGEKTEEVCGYCFDDPATAWIAAEAQALKAALRSTNRDGRRRWVCFAKVPKEWRQPPYRVAFVVFHDRE